ncbi:hypothetical protein I3843_16G112800 [Carya illinoinensis]|nr:hypothetical protein I3843_16G112800 [Carya illinoinensis]
MLSKTVIALFCVFLSLALRPSEARTWVKAGYWFSGTNFPLSDINSALFTHLFCAFAGINPSSYELSISSDDEKYFPVFSDTVKQRNPSITTLLSIGGGGNASLSSSEIFSLMVNSSVHRKSFVDSSIKIARLYGFQGLDLNWISPGTSSDVINMGNLFEEWRVAAESEAKNSSQPQLILTAAVNYSPDLGSVFLPVDSMQSNLNWLNIMAYDYHAPNRDNFTAAHAALYDPRRQRNTDYGIRTWISRGLSAEKLVLGLPFYGYAWNLVDSKDNAIGAPATGPAITTGGDMTFKAIKDYIRINGAAVVYNSTYVENYCIAESVWIGFDDVEAVRTKVSYAKEMRLLGYYVWQVPNDDHNWVLSLAAAEEGDHENQNQKGRLLVIVLVSSGATIVLLLGSVWVMCYLRKRKVKLTGTVLKARKEKEAKVNGIATAGNLNTNVPDLEVYSYADIEMATNKFSFENKLGEGGYGPVYKGVLVNKQEIAVKKLSKASTQGFEEFKNEVTLTAKLQHVNLVRVLGFCIERDEQMLIYEYMPNKSLDFYLFDSARRFLLDWKKRVHIIEGITQGLLYLQEYSRLTIIHRDLKASNILLDNEMKPKISDFGMAKIFSKDEHEANTGRIVGTYGYVPPEYVKKGLYSTKSDVYSFGVLILQIISGKKNACFYGLNEDLNLLEYAYDSWKSGKGKEFMDPSLDDTVSSCKLIRCLQIGLLCVQENAADRPSILEISSMLKSESAALTIPKIPAFSTKGNRDEQTKSQIQLENCSINDTTLSQMVSR